MQVGIEHFSKKAVKCWWSDSVIDFVSLKVCKYERKIALDILIYIDI